MNTIKVRPVLLPTKDTKSILVIDDNSRRLHICKPNEAAWGHQQIVLISLDPNEKIGVGDLMYDFNGGITKNIGQGVGDFKIIATQDQLSPELINQLVSKYNNGGMKDFKIEIEKLYSCEAADEFDAVGVCGFRPKLTNGFVTVVVEKELILYTEEEIFTLGDKYEEYCINCFGNLPKSFSEWFNQNKKK